MNSASPRDIPVEFLFDSSKNTLQEYELSRLNLAANLKKELRAAMEGVIDSLVEARFARWLLEHKEELCSTVGTLHAAEEILDFGSDPLAEGKAKFSAPDRLQADAAD